MVLAWTGLPQLLLIPLVPRLMRRFDARLVIGVGFALFAASQLHEHPHDRRLCRRPAVLAQHRPRHRPGTGA